MNINQIRALPDSLVLSGLKTRVLKERENMTEVLEFLREVDRRRLYAESNHASLWSFCTVELKYSAGAASRRIEAMRLLRDLPELKEDLVSGKQNLSSLALAQNFFRSEEKNQEEKLTPEKKQEIISQLEGKSTRDCQAALADLSSKPIEIKRPERKRAVGKKHTELKLVLEQALLEKLDRIKALRSHANPSMSYKELLEFMADEILKRYDPLEKAKVVKKAREKSPAPAPELKVSKRIPIPAETKRLLWSREQGKCGFVDPATGKRCDSTYFLECDHIIEVALGGTNELQNLRLRCRGHNQRSSVKTFGPRQE